MGELRKDMNKYRPGDAAEFFARGEGTDIAENKLQKWDDVEKSLREAKAMLNMVSGSDEP
ncbi:MAG: hypothetical protein NTZ78_09950 [Candidatus Aureabacteria bacterium]|nr:hypothetical protein [Candidatus Auribacterota bacterium]